MLQSEFENLYQNMLSISIDELGNASDRTLLLGETKEGEVFHVYLRDNRINRVRYNPECPQHYSHVAETMLASAFLVPAGGKVFAEFCDVDFCRQLVLRSIYIPFAEDPQFNRDENHVYNTFHAKTHYTLTPPDTADIIDLKGSDWAFMKALGDGNVHLWNNKLERLEMWYYNKNTSSTMSVQPRIRHKNSLLNFARVEKLPAPSSYNKA